MMSIGATAVNDLMSDLADMKKFKKDVDSMLTTLHSSQAAPGRVGEDRLPRTHLGGHGFLEAQFLYASYNNVHDELESLSKALGLQIESLGIAIETAGKSYKDLDDDVKTRMHKLNSEIEAQYHPSRDPYAHTDKKELNPQSGGYAQGGDGA
ncbi:hypothetical protein [Streptomyces montanisoli]|uniref:Uncharacterized protein n=1 Tax=Streptomyces montanisoli TaxID=2798581 RepID=A0A940MHB2_9ACTN|nr:hypothetical protein [Streptomyces montanisoli]MBP0458598.1 hypothetical protein [Streptomyces montanisoli]